MCVVVLSYFAWYEITYDTAAIATMCVWILPEAVLPRLRNIITRPTDKLMFPCPLLLDMFPSDASEVYECVNSGFMMPI